jgi:uncharacterized protein involved in exopolysaccharide biosynthesis
LIKKKGESQKLDFEEVHQMITNLKVQIEEGIGIKETHKRKLEENKFLEAEIVTKRKEEDKREDILTSHLKERYEDLNKLEAKFSQQEKRLKEEIVSLKTQLEEVKRKEEVTEIQMMKKEEYCENIEEEVVTLRIKVVKLNKNVEGKGNNTSLVNKIEEKCY